MGWNYLSIPKLQRAIWEWISNFIPHFTGHVIIIHAGLKFTPYRVRGFCTYTLTAPMSRMYEVIRQYDSCNTGELDRHAQHQQPCLASRTLRVFVRQEQPVLSGTHWSSFAQMSVVLCLRRFPMKIENCHIRHQKPPKVHQGPPP